MNIEYHLKSIESHEKTEVKEFLEDHINNLSFVEGHCQAQKESDLALLKIICAVSKNQKTKGPCKYLTSLHLYLPTHHTKHIHVIKKEGLSLISVLKGSLEALTHHLQHVISRLKSHRA